MKTDRQLEDLPLADFSWVPERFLLLVRTKSINENFVNWKLRPLLLLQSWFNAFSILRVSANTLYDCYLRIVDSFIFIHQWSQLFFPVKGYCVYMIKMVACRYGISLLVFNSTSHSFAALTRELSSLNTQREIPYLRAPMYYSLFLTWVANNHTASKFYQRIIFLVKLKRER